MQQKTEILRARARHRLWAAVLFLDDFTGRPIAPGMLQVRSAELPGEPVSKQDGWYLFLNYDGETLTVTASGRFYNERTVRIHRENLDPLNPTVRVRMTPGRNYGVPAHASCVEGTAAPDREIRIWCSNDPRPLRLLCDYLCDGPHHGRQIRLFDPSGENLEGRSFALLRKGTEKAEIFTICRCPEGEEGTCLLENPLRGPCKKAGASVFPVFTVRTDHTGKFFLLLPGMAVRKISCRIQAERPDGSWQEHTAELEPGTMTRLEPFPPDV